jgi:hypothetical protein
MLCSNCQQREARLEHFHVGSWSGPVCKQCAVELGARFIQRSGEDLHGLSPEQIAAWMESGGEDLFKLMQEDPPTTDPKEIARRLKRSRSDPGSGAA